MAIMRLGRVSPTADEKPHAQDDVADEPETVLSPADSEEQLVDAQPALTDAPQQIADDEASTDSSGVVSLEELAPRDSAVAEENE